MVLARSLAPLQSRRKLLPSLLLKRHPPTNHLHPNNHHYPSRVLNFKPKSMATCIDTCRAGAETAPATQLSGDPNRSLQGDRCGAKFCRPRFSDLAPCSVPISSFASTFNRAIHARAELDPSGGGEEDDEDDLWAKMQDEARLDVDQEPILSAYYLNSILSHRSLESALAHHLSMKLSSSSLPSATLLDLFAGVLASDPQVAAAAKDDLRAAKERDPACLSYVHCFLNFKGFHACQAHRVAHGLWTQGRRVLALLIQNRVSEVFAVDIHPGARIGRGVLLDHATGLVVGETAVVGDNVSILHNVTLGGTGKTSGDRHPKIGDGVLIGAGTCVLGNVRIGEGAKIGAGSVVIKEVPPRTSAVGNPARLVGGTHNPIKLDNIPGLTMDHTSHISDQWSDYVI